MGGNGAIVFGQRRQQRSAIRKAVRAGGLVIECIGDHVLYALDVQPHLGEVRRHDVPRADAIALPVAQRARLAAVQEGISVALGKQEHALIVVWRLAAVRFWGPAPQEEGRR